MRRYSRPSKKEIVGTLLLAGALLGSGGPLFAQTGPLPSFKFLRDRYGAPPDKRVLKELQGFSVEPTPVQKKEILTSLLRRDLRPPFFLSLAKRFEEAFDKDLRAEFNAKLRSSPDPEDFKSYGVEENAPLSPLTLEESQEDPAVSAYAFRCLDFDKDKIVDLVIFNQVYFGPSPGLVFCGRTEKGFSYLYDCSGSIAAIDRLPDRLLIRYVVTIIDPSETEILATVAYDFKTHICALESKLYYAQQTRFPKILGRPEGFEAAAPAVLRFNAKIDNTPVQKTPGGYEEFKETRTLYGNAVAEFPKEAGGYVLASEGAWAFVAFGTRILPTDHSLRHGLEPGSYDPKTETFTPIYWPFQYFCGWMEKRFISPKKN